MDNANMHRYPVKERLQKLINEHPLIMGNANELARRTGVSQSTITRVLTGEVEEPRSSTLAPLANFFDIEVSDFWVFDNQMPEVRESAPTYALNPIEQEILDGTRDLPAHLKNVVLILVKSLNEVIEPTLPKVPADKLSRKRDSKKSTNPSESRPEVDQHKK